MNVAPSGVWNTTSVRAAPRRAPLRLAPGCGYAEQVWSLQAFALVGRRTFRSPMHHRPNNRLKRSAQRRCRWVPVVRRTPAPA